MSDLFWPGDERAEKLMSDSALLHAMVRVEAAWLAALVDAGITGADAADDLDELVTQDDVPTVAVRAEAGGNPLIPLLSLLRERLGRRNATAASWLHRGLTSQDVLDTAVVLAAHDVLARLREEFAAQVVALTGLARAHRTSVLAGRTLTQHAVPITFGLKAASWLRGVLDAADDVAAAGAGLPSQFGGAAGSLAAATELARLAGFDDPARAAVDLVAHASATLRLPSVPPWHTARAPLTRLGDALVRCTDAWGRVANDVLTLSRPEIAELAEPAAHGRGSSSAMPQKANPVLSVLVRRAALAAPALGAQLHLAATESVDERPDGAWHVEWPTVRTLARRTVVAASQTTELLTGLRVDVRRMGATAEAAAESLLAEQGSVAALFGQTGADDPAGYLGANDAIIDAVLDRAKPYLEEDR